MNIAKMYNLVKPLLKADPQEHAKVLVLIEAERTDEAMEIMDTVLSQWHRGRKVEFDERRTIGLF